MNQFYYIWEEGLAHSFQWTSQTVCRTMPHNRHPFLPQNCQHYECTFSKDAVFGGFHPLSGSFRIQKTQFNT